MNRKVLKHVDSLERRANLLTERLKDWHGKDEHPTRRELIAINFALTVIREADRRGIVEDLAEGNPVKYG